MDKTVFEAHAGTLTKLEVFQGKVIVCILSRAGTPDKFKLTVSVRGDEFAQIAERLVGWLTTTIRRRGEVREGAPDGA